MHPSCPRSAASAAREGERAGGRAGAELGSHNAAGGTASTAFFMLQLHACSSKAQRRQGESQLFSLGKGKGEGRVLMRAGCVYRVTSPLQCPLPSSSAGRCEQQKVSCSTVVLIWKLLPCPAGVTLSPCPLREMGGTRKAPGLVQVGLVGPGWR